jgi:hypothetical protein
MEQISGEKGGKMSERSEFFSARPVADPFREPAEGGQGAGAPFSAYSFLA